MSFLAKSTELAAVCRKRASKELNETTNQVSAHLASFKRWILSMPHLQCPTDDDFLLAFLRHAKFNHSKAQTRLDNFCTFFTSPKDGCPDWFLVADSDRETYEKLLDLKFSVPIGVLENGTFCILVKLANYDLTAISEEKLQQLNILFNTYIMLDEVVQIAGFCAILDFTGCTMKQVASIFNPKNAKNETKFYQEAFPLRLSKIVFYNMPAFFDGMFRVIDHYLKDKLRGKTMVLRGSLQEAFTCLPGLEKLTPCEYGGKNVSYDTICDARRKVLSDIFINRRTLKITVDESKRPEIAQNLLRVYKDVSLDTMGISGTYVKLEGEI